MTTKTIDEEDDRDRGESGEKRRKDSIRVRSIAGFEYPEKRRRQQQRHWRRRDLIRADKPTAINRSAT